MIPFHRLNKTKWKVHQ